MGVNPFVVDEAALPDGPAVAAQWGKAYGCAAALVLSELRDSGYQLRLALLPTVAAAETLEAQLQFFCSRDRGIALFPDPETLPYDNFSPHQGLVSALGPAHFHDVCVALILRCGVWLMDLLAFAAR